MAFTAQMNHPPSRNRESTPISRYRHGLVSLLLVAAAMATALTTIWRQSPGWGWLYLALVTAGSASILFAYCAKCPCRLHACGHVIPGPLTRFLPAREQGSYGTIDYLGVILPLALLLVIPQPWLWSDPPAMVLFWLLLAAGAMDILAFVCRGCDNHRCPLRHRRN